MYQRTAVSVASTIHRIIIIIIVRYLIKNIYLPEYYNDVQGDKKKVPPRKIAITLISSQLGALNKNEWKEEL